MTVTAQYAAEHFEEVSDAADQGETVEIQRPGKKALQLIVAPLEEVSNHRRYRLGTGVGMLTHVPTHEEWSAMDRELWSDKLDGDITPTEL